MRFSFTCVLCPLAAVRHHPVGRLDADSTGLLLLSSDGALTHRLLNPRFVMGQNRHAR